MMYQAYPQGPPGPQPESSLPLTIIPTSISIKQKYLAVISLTKCTPMLRLYRERCEHEKTAELIVPYLCSREVQKLGRVVTMQVIW
jgi:hypothetical protein